MKGKESNLVADTPAALRGKRRSALRAKLSIVFFALLTPVIFAVAPVFATAPSSSFEASVQTGSLISLTIANVENADTGEDDAVTLGADGATGLMGFNVSLWDPIDYHSAMIVSSSNADAGYSVVYDTTNPIMEKAGAMNSKFFQLSAPLTCSTATCSNLTTDGLYVNGDKTYGTWALIPRTFITDTETISDTLTNLTAHPIMTTTQELGAASGRGIAKFPFTVIVAMGDNNVDGTYTATIRFTTVVNAPQESADSESGNSDSGDSGNSDNSSDSGDSDSDNSDSGDSGSESNSGSDSNSGESNSGDANDSGESSSESD